MNVSTISPFDTDAEINMPLTPSRPMDVTPQPQAPSKPRVVEIFRLLSDVTRWSILRFLHRSGEQDVTSICEHLQQSQPGISHHLSLLRRASILRIRRSGKHNYYSLNPDAGAGRFVTELLGRFNRPTPPRQGD